ncbi:carboxypeptidase-like regulatory domain-containing protein [Streptomyces sp. JB150]|uniref:carboxypeptidase-like regulatory domain-containing protein n=1 Tax=Streptomyces sp. JB150 TaxID=2714844 RepID=UPI003211EA29
MTGALSATASLPPAESPSVTGAPSVAESLSTTVSLSTAASLPAAEGVPTAEAVPAAEAVPEAGPLRGFRGRVLAADGTPVPGARITLIDRRGRRAGATLSAEDGGYALTVPAPGPYVIAAQAAGHAPHASAATHAGDDRPVELNLSLPGGTVTA